MLGIIIFGFIIFGFFSLILLIGVGLLSSSEAKSKARAEANKDQILADTFNGDAVVTIKVGPAGLDYSTVMRAAPNYGYKFLSQIGKDPSYTVSFQKE